MSKTKISPKLKTKLLSIAITVNKTGTVRELKDNYNELLALIKGDKDGTD